MHILPKTSPGSVKEIAEAKSDETVAGKAGNEFKIHQSLSDRELIEVPLKGAERIAYIQLLQASECGVEAILVR